VEDHAAAGRHDPAAAGEALAQPLRFQRPERGLALLGEQFGDAAPRDALDVVVEVAERKSEARREAPADAALAGAHGTHEHQVGSGIHEVRCYPAVTLPR